MPWGAHGWEYGTEGCTEDAVPALCLPWPCEALYMAASVHHGGIPLVTGQIMS